MTEETPSRSRDDASFGTGLGRRKFIAASGSVSAALLAGCSSDEPSGDGTQTDDGGDGETADFRLLVSDAPADIDDFDRLDVTFDEARVFEGDGDEDEQTETEETDGEQTETEGTDDEQTETEDVEEDQQQTTDEQTQTENGTATATDDGTTTATENGTETDDGTATENGTETESGDGEGEGDRGFYVLDLDDPTVDLTQVVGDKAEPIFDGELEAGSYQKLELHVADVEGIVDGEEVEVKVPSNKLQLTKPFEVRAGEALDFVFDINVVKRGQQQSYNLKPVISQSGVRGEDVEVEENGGDESAGGDGSEQGDDSDGAGANESDDGGAGDAEQGSGAGNETGGNETSGAQTDGNETSA